MFASSRCFLRLARFPLGVVMSEFVALVFRPLAMFRNRRPAPAVRVLSVLGSPAMVRQLTFAFAVLLFLVVVVVPLGATSPWETVGERLCELFLNKLGKALAIVAVIIGGLMYAFGEGGSKSQIAGLAFGAGMVLLAPQFLGWIIGTGPPGCGG